jgi:type II secretory pathway predicted ATPase ExeA
MYESFFGLSARPFSLAPDPQYLLMTRQHETALTMLEYAITGDTLISVLTGEVGSGKTTLLMRLIQRIEPTLTVGLVNNTYRGSGTLMQWVCAAFGIDALEREPAAQYQAFRAFLAGQRERGNFVLLIVDEAQNLGSARLEELRVLSNVNEGGHVQFQLILVGQPELRDTLRRPQLRQLAQRVGIDYHLTNLAVAQAREYVRHRLEVAGGERGLFTDDAIDLAYRASGGTPRLLNQLCDLGLLFAFAGHVRKVDAEIMTRVVRSRQDGGIFPRFGAVDDQVGASLGAEPL